jgi:hypothetical protein
VKGGRGMLWRDVAHGLAMAWIVLALSGCTQTQLQRMREARQERERQAEEQRQRAVADIQERQRATAEAQARRIDDACLAYGFKPNTDGFASCRQRETEKMQAAWARASKELQDAQIREQAVNACKLAMMGMPTRSGHMENLDVCDSDPQAAAKLQQKRSEGYLCSPAGNGSTVCQPQ